MKKTWVFILLTPLMSLSAAYPIYDEEYETSYELELNTHEEVIASEPAYDEWNEEVAQEQLNEGEQYAYENEVQEEEVLALPQKSSKQSGNLSLRQKRQVSESKVNASAPSRSKKAASSIKRGSRNQASAQRNTSPRTKMKDARENTNRPRVTHRSQQQSNIEQIEADAQADDRSYEAYESEQPRKQYRAPKSARSQAFAEKRAGQGQMQRRSTANQKGTKGRTYQRPVKKSERRVSSHHPGKRPLND